MPDPVLLFTNDVFNREELRTFLSSLQIEGTKIFVTEPYPGFSYDAQISRNDQFVNVAYEEHLTYEEDEEADLAPIKQALGAEPKTCVLLDIGKHAPGTELLGLEVAAKLLEHWPGIIDVLREVEHRYLTLDDIRSLYKKNYSILGFPIHPVPKVSQSRSLRKKRVKRPRTKLVAQNTKRQ